jgi:hypothetical protein
MRMLRARAKLIVAIALCAPALCQSGCFSRYSSATKDSANSLAISKSAGASVASPSTPNAQAPRGLGDADMAGVLDKLEQVRNIDPVAERRLLDELRRAPASSWPLVAEQFRASLAYREQLKSRDPAGNVGDLSSQLRLAMRERTTSQPWAGKPSAQPLLVARESSPRVGLPLPNADAATSTPIGVLADPHGATNEEASVLATASPYSLPSPMTERTSLTSTAEQQPAEFADDGRATPIFPPASSANENAALAAARDSSASPSDVVNAKLEEPVTTAEEKDEAANAADRDWQELVKDATADLGQRVAASPTTTAEVHQHVSLRILRLLAGDTEKALEAIPHISPAEQDYWSKQLFALATYLDHHAQPDDKRRAAASVTHLDEAVSNLRELGSLSLRNLAFCKNVYGYGAIETYDKDLFSPGQQVSLYVEVENYHSRSTDKGYCTSLGSTYELLDEKGTRVSGGEFPVVDDCCRSRRRDFHIQFGLTLPEKMTPGRYELDLVIKDRQSDKIGHATATFEIRGSAATRAVPATPPSPK